MRFSDTPTPESMVAAIQATDDEQRLQSFFNDAHDEWTSLHLGPAFTKKYEQLELFSVFRSAITYAEGDPAVARSLLKTKNVWDFLMTRINQLPFETALRVASMDYALMVNPATPASVLNILLSRYSTAASCNPLYLLQAESNGWTAEEQRRLILENLGEMALPLAAFTQATPPQRVDILLDFFEFLLEVSTRYELNLFKNNTNLEIDREMVKPLMAEEANILKVVRFGRMNSAKETIGSSIMPFLRNSDEFQSTNSRSTVRIIIRSLFEKIEPYQSHNHTRVEEFTWGLLLEPLEGFADDEMLLGEKYGRLCFQVFLADRIQARGIFPSPSFRPHAFESEQALRQEWHDAVVHFQPTPTLRRSRR